MDQVKIGKFIADLRKEKEMTQKELAETIGVSDKTISKWECGNGMPEMSMLMPLCQALQINVNELLSGERLSADSYSRKAEENIINLMQENEEHKKHSKKNIVNAVLIIILSLIAVLAVVVMSFFMSFGHNWGEYFSDVMLDPGAIIPMLLVAVLGMSAAKMWKPFFRVFGIVFAHREYSVFEVKESGIALRMLGNVWALAGIVSTIISLIITGYYIPRETTVDLSLWTIGVTAAISMIPLMYGYLGKLLLLPIQSRLESIAEKRKYQA